MPDILKSTKIIVITAILTLFLSYACFASSAGNYAALPPFLSFAVKPNALVVMDFSGSMQAPANYGTHWHGYPWDNRIANYGDLYEIEEDYVIDNTYYGYFDSEAYYKYNSTQDYWEIDDNTSYSGNDVGDVDSLSGNFLNYIVMSRIDVALKSLIGGKASCPDGADYCILESQGSRRWVEVDNLDAYCHVRPENFKSGDYADKNILISIYRDYYNPSQIGTFVDRYARVKIDAQDRKGIIQENESKVRFGFIAYASGGEDGNSSAEEGMIKYGVHEDDVSGLIDAFQTTVPYWGTHTGEAMREAYNYLKQTGMFSYNSGYQDQASAIDPYYQGKADGTADPAWCRKSYVILISDGEWDDDQIDPDGWAYKLHTEDLRETNSAGVDDQFPGTQNADVYSIFTFSDDIAGIRSMKTVAAFGNFKDNEGCTDGFPYDFYDVTSGDDDSREVEYPRSNCDPDNTYEDCCAEWDETGDGIPDAFFNASDGAEIAEALTKVFKEIRLGTSSGTAVTAITSRSTTGSIITQGIFYPEKEFEDDRQVNWSGNLFSEWYLNANVNGTLVQNIREDTDGDFALDVFDDRILNYVIEDEALQIHAYEPDSDGTKSASPAETYSAIEDVANLIDFGEKLKDRDESGRTIYGVAENNTRTDFTTTNAGSFDALLGSDPTEYPSCLLDSSGNVQYDKLIRFVRGEEVSGCRTRLADDSGNVWKLGDVIYSSPTMVNYGDYRMIYAGSNSGMLHAFRLGYLNNTGNKDQPAKLSNDKSSLTSHDELGKEEWAFIPKDSMPYLRYMADPAYDHMYTVDLKPYIIDTEDKTILIGGMRLGGASEYGTKPPPDTDPIGRSAYYALDIRDPMNPEYLWRFETDGMGLTYSGPAYVKRRDSTGTLKHYVIFASGPSDYDGTCADGQDLEIYVVDLLNGDLLHTHDAGSNFKYTFGGRLFTDGLDLRPKDGQTDFVLLGFTNKASGPYDKMSGGIYKIFTGTPEPSGWVYDTFLPNAIQNPITGPIRVMECFPNRLEHPYLVFGSGRYFVPNDKTGGNNDNNALYGVPFTCDEQNVGCSTISNITDSSDLKCDDIMDGSKQGAWKIELNPAEGNFLRERCYANPSTTKYNIVFFDTAMPTDVTCECGGKSRSWAVNCATGRGLLEEICSDAPFKVKEDLPFKYLIQLSGGDIKEPERGDFDEGGDGGPGDGSTDDNPGLTSEEGGLPLFPPRWAMEYWKQW